MKTKLLHVSSTSTANRADGSAKRPYATLEAARDALRKLRAQDGMRMPVRVLVVAPMLDLLLSVQGDARKRRRRCSRERQRASRRSAFRAASRT